MANILFITTEGFDTPGPNNEMAQVIIKDLVKMGHNIHLIQSSRQNINPQIPESLEALSGFTHSTIKRKNVDKSNFVIRYLDEMKYSLSAFKEWRKVKNIDLVFLQSAPTSVYSTILLKIFLKKPIILNIYDMFPGHAINIGVMSNKLLFNILRMINKISYSLTTKMIVLSQDMKDKLIEENVPVSKIEIVPAWFDTSRLSEVSELDNRFIRKFNIDKSKFIVQFAGTIGMVFDYQMILDVAHLLRDFPNIMFQIVGSGVKLVEFQTKVEDMKLSNIDFYPLQPLSLVPDVYSAADICIIPLKKGVIGNGVPSKAPLVMSCRRTILNSVEPESSYAKMFHENQIGVSVSNDSPASVADAIIKLYETPTLVEKYANNALNYAKDNFSSDNSIDLIDKIISKVSEKV